MHVVKCQLKNIQVYFTFGNFLKGSESAGYAFDECLIERNVKVYFFLFTRCGVRPNFKQDRSIFLFKFRVKVIGMICFRLIGSDSVKKSFHVRFI